MLNLAQNRLASRILLDLVHTWEECNHRDHVSGWRVCFRKCLLTLLHLSDAGLIRQTGSAGNYWSILPTELGIAQSKTLSLPKSEWLYTIADLNS